MGAASIHLHLSIQVSILAKVVFDISKVKGIQGKGKARILPEQD